MGPFTTHCCNPFNITSHCVKKSLRPVNNSMKRKMPELVNKSSVCASCRLRIGRLDDANLDANCKLNFLIDLGLKTSVTNINFFFDF